MAKMTVKELKELLTHPDIKDDDLVVMSSDPEGNSYHPLDGYSIEVCSSDGEIFPRELTPEMREQGYTEEDLYQGDDGKNVVVLWPGYWPRRGGGEAE